MKIKWSNFFQLSIKKILVVMALFIVFVVLHNLISAVINIEEALFFILAIFGVPLYLLIATPYTIYKKFFKR